MAEYSRKFGSQFPGRVMELHNYQNVTTDLYPIVEQYRKYCEVYDLESANILLSQYPELKNCKFDTDDINLFDEERYNTQLYALSKGQVVIVSEEEPLPQPQLVWIGGTE